MDQVISNPMIVWSGLIVYKAKSGLAEAEGKSGRRRTEVLRRKQKIKIILFFPRNFFLARWDENVRRRMIPQSLFFLLLLVHCRAESKVKLLT